MATPEQFARRLADAASAADHRADGLESEWGEVVADEMRRRAPVLTGRLRDSIRQVEPGVVVVGADYGIYVDRGTSRMPPQEFSRPSVNAVRSRVVNEGLTAAVNWI